MEIKEIILVIEDDKAIAKILTAALEDSYKVIVSKSLEDAYRKFTSFNPSLILLDLGLPDGDGKEFIKRVRELGDKPIIVVSARFDEKEIVNCLDLGADDYVTFDLSMSGHYGYYTGIVFRAYTYGTGDAIVTGGRYDHLLEKFGKQTPSIGFAIIIDELQVMSF